MRKYKVILTNHGFHCYPLDILNCVRGLGHEDGLLLAVIEDEAEREGVHSGQEGSLDALQGGVCAKVSSYARFLAISLLTCPSSGIMNG